MSSPAALVVPAIKKHTASVIMAHGLGDSSLLTLLQWRGASLAENWRRRGKFEEVAFIFPNAPIIPITINMGMRMPGWYDIVRQRTTFSSLSTSFDEPGILRSRTTLLNLISAEINKGIPSTRILLGGFSQGGAMSLFTGITSPYKLGGIFGLSCYMLMPDRIRTFIPQTPKPPPRQVGDEGGAVEEEEVDEDRGANAKTKIWMGHGEDDPLVRMDWGRQTAGLLGAWGWSVGLKAYEGLEHSAATEEIDDLEDFVKACLAANPYVEDGAGEASTAESKAGAEKAAGRSPL